MALEALMLPFGHSKSGIPHHATPSRLSTATSINPQRVLLSSRTQIDRFDGGLSGIAGAREIIRDISSRRTVTKLVLGHNDLGDDGTVLLFTFLNSSSSRSGPIYKQTITEINLNGNAIGNKGLQAITQYLEDNSALKELTLQNVTSFTGDAETLESFASALNRSQVRFLSLTSNPLTIPHDSTRPCPVFASSFLAKLDAPSLHELHLSALGLPRSAVPYLVDYLTSAERCRLHTFKCNGNGLGIRGMTKIIRGIGEWRKGQNFRLLKIEMYANRAPGPDEDVEEEAEEEGDGDDRSYDVRWKELEQELKATLQRNGHLQRAVQQQALELLHHSRPMLLKSTKADMLPRPSNTPQPRSLPIELRLHILSHLAPDLSARQRIRIYDYASSPETLPDVPRVGSGTLSSSNCIPDPGSFPLGAAGTGGSHHLISPGPGSLLSGTIGSKIWDLGAGHGAFTGCANGRCMGAGNSVLCRREQQRVRWLEDVGCAAFEL